MHTAVTISHPNDILILAHREALKNAMEKAFTELGIGNIKEYEEQEKQQCFHQGAIKALEQAKEQASRGWRACEEQDRNAV